MDRVAWVVVVLYLALLALLTVPHLLFSFPEGSKEAVSFSMAMEAMQHPITWIFILFLLLCQIALLAIPVRSANERPIGKAPVWATIVVGAFFMALLVYSLLLVLTETTVLNQAKDPWFYITLAIFFIMWIVWGLLFKKTADSESPESLSNKVTRWMIRASILEVLIAIPAHVYVRQKTYCCAGFLTFFGLTMGICIMLIAFGPGIYYLYRAKIAQKRGE